MEEVFQAEKRAATGNTQERAAVGSAGTTLRAWREAGGGRSALGVGLTWTFSLALSASSTTFISPGLRFPTSQMGVTF